MSTATSTLTVTDLTMASGLTDRFDVLIDNLTNAELLFAPDSQLDDSTLDNSSRYCQVVRRAVNADTIYLCHRTTLDIVATSSAPCEALPCTDTEALHMRLTTTVSDLWMCEETLYLPAISVFSETRKNTFIVVPLHNYLLVMMDADIEPSLLGQYYAYALEQCFAMLNENPKSDPQSRQTQLRDSLHERFGNSSQATRSARLEKFTQALRLTSLDFRKEVNTWHSDLDPDLYSTAALWGSEFKLALDTYCLTEAAYGYKVLCEHKNMQSFKEAPTLNITAHQSSLQSVAYIDALQQLIERVTVHPSRLSITVLPSTNTNAAPESKTLEKLFASSEIRLIPHRATYTPANIDQIEVPGEAA